jgi:hypothetical protein
VEQLQYGVLDVFTAAVQQLTGTVLLESFECTHSRPEDKAVDSLDKLFLKLLQLNLLLGPTPGARRHIDRVDLLVVLDQVLNGLRCKLERNLML